jgi:hypothetical protein
MPTHGGTWFQDSQALSLNARPAFVPLPTGNTEVYV